MAVAGWQQLLSHDAVTALLDTGDPDISYFVRRDLVGEEVGPLAEVWNGPGAERLFRKQQKDGSWRGPTKKTAVYPENHSDLLETFKQVRLLVERYELDRSDERMQRAAKFLFSFQTGVGDLRGFIGNQYATYYTGYVLSLLIRAGYGDDPRVTMGMEWLLSMRQDDGGWTIPILTHTFDRKTGYELTSTYEKPVEPDRTKPFSHNWTDMVLRAFAVHPEYRESPEVQHAGALLKSEFFQPDAYNSYRDARYWTRFAFWWPNLLTAMESLHLLGFTAEDPAMKRGIDWFCANQATDGLWWIKNDGAIEWESRLVKERRAWLGLRICRLLARLV